MLDRMRLSAQQALFQLRKILELDPDSADARNNLAVLLRTRRASA
jgi:hypothetical protein